MKLSKKLLRQNLVRILEEDFIKEVKEEEPITKVLETAHYLRLAYRTARNYKDQYQGHEKLMEKVFVGYINKKV